MQPCGSRVPEAAPLHIPRWQWHCLCPVRRNRPDQMSAVCSEDPGTVWRQCSLTGMAPELRKGTVASMPDGIPVREAISACSMEVSGRHYGGRVGAGEGDSWSYPNWDIRERLPWNGYKNLRGRAWVCAVSPLTVVRTGLHSPITYCSNQYQWLGYYKERHCWLAVWVLTCLGPRCQPLPRAILMPHIVKGKR